MRITSDDSRHDLLSAADDGFHVPCAPRDHGGGRWFHETVWFWWYVPEHRLGGWLYNWVRPNIGTSGGGAWVWDDTTFFHLETPYYACYSTLAFAPGSDLRKHRFPSGVSVECLEPLARYRLGFADDDRLALELDFAAVMPPSVAEPAGDPPVATHYDQVGRVTGTMVLEGTSYNVDCLAIRDRTWSPRSERWKEGRVGYTNACNDSVGFLATTGEERVRSGYFVQDGRRASLVDGIREIQRDPEYGFLRRIVVEAEDRDGRRFRATGDPLSRMAMPIPGVHGVVWTTLVGWQIDGRPAWGEDQDAWPINRWSQFRRRSSPEPGQGRRAVG